MNLAWFPSVLGCHAVELLFDDGGLSGIRDVGLVDGNTNREIVLVGILESGAC